MKLKNGKNYLITGIMSGTSLDGLDLAACNFTFDQNNWKFHIEHAKTYPYPEGWKARLHSLLHANAEELAYAHFDFGKLTGDFVNRFHHETGFDPLLVASHGHTVFHNPEKSCSFQIGNGAAIASICKKPVVCDFRAADVSLGGQGAPLVPIGDQLLFNQYDACLNLGGFSNISFSRHNKRIAFDICPVNTLLNILAHALHQPYDDKGIHSKQGTVDPALLDKLNKITYYFKIPPKSLGSEWLESSVLPLIKFAKGSVNDKLRTCVEHIAMQISNVVKTYNINTLLVTGGGAYNDFLIERLGLLAGCEITIPDKKTIEYKEALVFALLGLLRWKEQTNCLASATGAVNDSIGGAVYLPVK
jgi:anhydro-N-acetylmuramic acid kinase